jgi:hypothetical protein
MGNPRPKQAIQTMPLEFERDMTNVLKEHGYKPMGETPMGGLEFVNDAGLRVVVDKDGWTQESSIEGEHLQTLDFGSNPKDLQEVLTKQHGKPTKPYPEGYVPPIHEGDKMSLRGLGVIGRVIARKSSSDPKRAGRPPRFQFAVPMSAGDKVAFHLAKAGMDDFDVLEVGSEALFVFKNEPELHVAEDIVKETFAEQIASRKGEWGLWAPPQQDPSAVNEIEMQGKPMMSSDKVADDYDPDRELEVEGQQDRELHEEMQRDGFDEAVRDALSAMERLYNIESSTDIMELARMTAADLRQFVEEYKSGRARKFSFATGKKCQGCAKVLPDVKDRVVTAAKETIEAALCGDCTANLAKEL